MEENFFFNQKSSVKQSIEFCCERLSNNLIKTVSQRIVAREVDATLMGLADTIKLLRETAAKVRNLIFELNFIFK